MSQERRYGLIRANIEVSRPLSGARVVQPHLNLVLFRNVEPKGKSVIRGDRMRLIFAMSAEMRGWHDC
jgi:hypothetical protein